jgi:hypothetical protein
MIDKWFVQAGKAVFTVEPASGFVERKGCCSHYTYRVTHRPATTEHREAWFIQLLTGPDNESDYNYLGMLDPAKGNVKLTAASKYAEDSWPVRILRHVLARLWAGEGEAIEASGWKVHHERRCGGCGRPLTDPGSIELGFGPECVQKAIVAAGS